MRKYSFLLLLGALVFITPFLAIPESLKSIFLFVLGACIILAALTYRFSSRREYRATEDTVYTENEPATHPVGEM